MNYFVTGVAGFVGSHIAEQLLAQGHEVAGVDCLLSNYHLLLKQYNLQQLHSYPHFHFQPNDLASIDLKPLVEWADCIIHAAAVPGLSSWKRLKFYWRNNIEATHQILEAYRQGKTKPQFIYLSSSSVYGEIADCSEDGIIAPISAYGLTKLAAEHLILAYQEQLGVPATILRLFSVYGPRQRPEMAYRQFIESIIDRRSLVIFGDGTRVRSNTYIDDCVQAILQVSQNRTKSTGHTLNIGGRDTISVNEAIKIIEAVLETKALVEYLPPREGDQKHTKANFTKAVNILSYNPRVSIRDGLARQVEWHLRVRHEFEQRGDLEIWRQAHLRSFGSDGQESLISEG